ncbi:MAG: hypothetical protein JRN62_02675 [Nitrososphaerota archaeon]|jgi:hypothetical protein|nr:hypothetical protein [Nitrososphaerota archaeon]MDG6948901.1 hypothetical protein [Nitrososphaerota archaeon]
MNCKITGCRRKAKKWNVYGLPRSAWPNHEALCGDCYRYVINNVVGLV